MSGSGAMGGRAFRTGGWLQDGALLAALIGVFYHVLLTGAALSPGADLVNLFLPMKAWTRQWLAQGVIPLWNPHTFMGAPFLATMQAAVLYPLNAPAVAFENLILGIHVYLLIHLWIMAMGVYWYLRFCAATPRALAVACCLAMPCGAFVTSHLDHINQLAAMAWFPWWMVALWACLRRPGRAVALALAVIGALQWLAGHPQQVVFTLVFSMAWLAAGTWRRSAPPGGRWAPWGCAAAGVALAMGLAAAQILPTMELSGRSLRQLDDWGQRSTWPPDPDAPPRYAARFAMEPELLALLVHPRAWRNVPEGQHPPEGLAESHSYVGLATLAGALLGLALAVRRRWGQGLFWTGAIVATFVFAMGDATPFHWALSTALAPLRHLRAPPRVLFIAVFGLCVLSAAGWGALLKRTEPGRWRATWPWALAGVIFLDLGLLFHTAPTARPIDALALTPPPRWERVAQTLGPGGRLFRLMPHDGGVYGDRDPTGVAERMARLAPNNPMAAGIALVDGYEEGLLPLARQMDFQRRYHRNFYAREPDPLLLALMNVHYVLAELPVESPWLTHEPSLRIQTSRGDYRFHRNALALPRVAPAEPLRQWIDFEELDGWWTRSGGAEPPTLNLEAPAYDYVRADGENRATDWARRADTMARWLDGPEGRAAMPEMEMVTPQRFAVRVPERSGPLGGTPERAGTSGEVDAAMAEPAHMDYLFLQAPYPGWGVDGGQGGFTPLTPLCAIASGFAAPGGEAGASWALVYRPFSFQLGLFVSLWTLGWTVGLSIAAGRPRRAPQARE